MGRHKGCVGNPGWNKGLTKDTDPRIEKYSSGRMGENNPNYKNGGHIGRINFWRNSVLERDNYTCQICGKDNLKGGDCQAHHIFDKEKHPEFKYEVWNGLTLCGSCHSKLTHENESEETRKRKSESHLNSMVDVSIKIWETRRRNGTDKWGKKSRELTL